MSSFVAASPAGVSFPRPQPVDAGNAPILGPAQVSLGQKKSDAITTCETELITMSGFKFNSLCSAANCWAKAMITDPTLNWLTDGKCPDRVVNFFYHVAMMFLRGTPDRSACWSLQAARNPDTAGTPRSSSLALLHLYACVPGGSNALPEPQVVCIGSEYPRTYPGTWTLVCSGLLRTLAAAPNLRTVGVMLRMVSAFDEAKARFFKENGPFLYIACFGTAPEFQGKGLGSQLIQEVLRHADSRGMPTYLEANSDDSRRFYERHGFKVLQSLTAAPGSPNVYVMARMGAAAVART